MSVTINGSTGVSLVQDGVIVDADIVTLAASKLTGALPAISGASLTGLPEPAELSTASGSAPSYSARAWVNFNGTGTVAIRDSGNVSSITDNGTGDYTVNFTTAMSDANYSAVIGWRVFSSVNIRAGGFNNYTTSSVDVYGGYKGGSNAFTAEDPTYASVSIFR